MTVRACVLVFVLLLASASGTAGEPVRVAAGDVTLTADLSVPPGRGPFPVVVALHGCNGMRSDDGQRLNARHRDWGGRLTAAGYAVLALDSFSARGAKEVCTEKVRTITPRMRADDVRAALIWLGTNPVIDAKRIALLGWSHGAMTVLWTVRPNFLVGVPTPFAAVAYYPGCTEISKIPGWRPSVAVTMLTGALDDWTPPAPCRALATQSGGIRYIEYPDAYHAFDAPNLPVRVRTGLGRVKGGEAHVGTNPEARAASIAEVMALLAVATAAKP